MNQTRLTSLFTNHFISIERRRRRGGDKTFFFVCFHSRKNFRFLLSSTIFLTRTRTIARWRIGFTMRFLLTSLIQTFSQIFGDLNDEHIPTISINNKNIITYWFQMHKITKTTTRTIPEKKSSMKSYFHRMLCLPHLILTTTCFVKVSDRTQFSVDCSSVKPTIIEIGNGFFSVFFQIKFDIAIA